MRGGTGQLEGGAVKEEGGGEVVVDEGDEDGDGDGEGVEVVDPPLCIPPPPPPPVASQSPGPPVCHRPEGGGDPLVSPGAGAGVRGASTRFFLPRA